MTAPSLARPDRLDRGIRMLRALRLSLATPAPALRLQQCEFEFVFRQAA